MSETRRQDFEHWYQAKDWFADQLTQVATNPHVVLRGASIEMVTDVSTRKRIWRAHIRVGMLTQWDIE